LRESLIGQSETEDLINEELDIKEEDIEEELKSHTSSTSMEDPEIKKKKIKFIKLKMDYKLLK
jgi:hypothetical protein